MKKLLSLIAIFSIILVMSCDGSPGLGGNKQEADNPFIDGEWERVFTSAFDNKPYQKFKISFTEKEFTFNEWSGNDFPGAYYDNTYKGTYILSPDSNLQKGKITFISTEPKVNGTAFYYFNMEATLPANAEEHIVFLRENNNSDNPLRIAGLFWKL